jgi:hypothetical protein
VDAADGSAKVGERWVSFMTGASPGWRAEESALVPF